MVNSSVNIKRFVGGAFSILFGVLSLIWTPYELVLQERLRMRPGLPPFDWWYNPPDVNRLKIYLFNITNADGFLAGKDEKLKMEEVGPIVFREVFTYTDVVFNDNGTMSYTSRRTVVYDPDLNAVDLNTTLTVPNMAVLLTVSYFWDVPYVVKVVLNYILGRTGKTIVKKTIYEILYNNTDPFLTLGHRFLRSVAIYGNIGLIPLMSRNQTSRVTVYVGTKFGHQNFFLINRYNGSIYVPSNQQCRDEIVDAADSIIYSQKVPKSRKVRYFYDLICKPINFSYNSDTYVYGLKGYRFILPGDEFSRTKPLEDDCYKSIPTLPDGLIDMSLCWDRFPVVMSFPHFLYGDPKLLTYVDGMRSNATLHSSSSILEPVTGINLELLARIQINIFVRPLQGFHRMFDRFSDMIVPYCHIEKYGAPPWYVIIFIHFVLLLPAIGGIMSSGALLFGVYCVWRCVKEARNVNMLPCRIRRRINSCVPEEQIFLNVLR